MKEKPRTQLIEKTIYNTFTHFDFPLTKIELYDMLISPQTTIDKDSFEIVINRMISDQELYSEEEYFHTNKNIKEKLENRINASKKAKTACREFSRKYKRISKLVPINFIGLFPDYFKNFDLNNDFVYQLMIITSPQNKNKAVSRSEKFFKLFGLSNLFNINKILDTESLTLNDKSIENAIELILLQKIYDPLNLYPKLLHKNIWVFEIFPNYPLQKISLNYKVTS